MSSPEDVTLGSDHSIRPSSYSGAYFGESISIYGSYLVIGTSSPTDGGVFIFKRVNDAWVQQTISYTASGRSDESYLTPAEGVSSLRFGISVSMYGDWLAVGADYSNGKVFIFKKNSSDEWDEVESLTYGSGGGFGKQLSMYNGYLAVGSNSTGVVVYKLNTSSNTWDQQTALNPYSTNHGHFGWSLQIYEDYLIIGDKNRDVVFNSNTYSSAGQVYIYEKTTTNGTESWGTLSQTLIPSVISVNESTDANNNRFGEDVSMYGNYLVVSSRLDDTNGSNAGIVYIFKYDSSTSSWLENTRFSAADTGAGDGFGLRVSLYDEYLLVCAWSKKVENVVNGVSYLFKNTNDTWTEEIRFFHDNPQSGDNHNRVFLNNNYAIIANIKFNNSDGGSTKDGIVYSYDMSNITGGSSSNEAAICFIGSTIVRTDQVREITAYDLYRQVTILGKKYTINQKPIKIVTKTKNEDHTLILIPQHAFGKGIPSCDTYVSKQHKILTNIGKGQTTNFKLIKAKHLQNYFSTVHAVRRPKKDDLFNVLLPVQDIVYIHNMPCESLHPSNQNVLYTKQMLM